MNKKLTERQRSGARRAASLPVVSATEVLNELSGQLQHASELDQSGEPDNRKAVTHALAYLIGALARLNYQQDELRPLEKLLHALGDLELGIQPKLLKKRILTDAPKQGHKETALYSMATVMIDLEADKLVNAGGEKIEAEEQAAKIVAPFMLKNKLSFPGRRDTPGFRSLLNWRKNTIYEKKNKIATHHYEFFSSLVEILSFEEAKSILRIRMANY